MAAKYSYDSILSAFDDLVKREIIYYAPRTTVQFEDDGFAVEFHISPSLSKKPQDGDPISGHENQSAKKPELFGPGSDIANDDPAMVIETINNTHLLVLNKFCMFRPQLLLLTSDSYRRQREPLGLEDLSAACTVLDALDWKPFVIYNGGPRAGASRQHKHLQVLPRPPRLFPDDGSGDNSVPYRYFLRYLHDIELGRPEGYAKLFEIYTGLLAEAKQSLKGTLEDEGYIPHNVALTREWIIVIPRRNIDIEGITANTAGMLGSVWLTSEEEVKEWKEVGPKKVLAGLGIPA
ncbi:ATP adenylyltransferase-domain-containing protein [Aspergillus karnatakaensis]|uniref:putative phosphorylase n=1 Tax=Aspergillus karnatakaensis TaxID=1810916 RepID=UPI003CCE3F5D